MLEANKKAIFTIGGATGSVYFANLVRTASLRQTFASKILAYLQANDFNGVDIDWCANKIDTFIATTERDEAGNSRATPTLATSYPSFPC